MRALLDVNVVIALLDPDHAFHERAHEWWTDQAKRGWASCPITENGVVRIMTNPGYSKKARFAPDDLILRLQTFTQRTTYDFWSDTLSLLDDKIFTAGRIHNSRQLTDFYLLALAAKYGGILATFDQGIAISAVRIASLKNLCVL
jgi:uncharacterized protein